MDRQRVHAAGKLTRERGVDHAMTLHAALPAEGFRHDMKPEMGFAAGAMPAVTFVSMGFVLDAKTLGRESLAQLFRDEIVGLHGSPALSMIRKRWTRVSEKIMLPLKMHGQLPGRAVLPPVKS